MGNERKILTVLLSVVSVIVPATVFGQSETLEKRFEVLAKNDLAELFASPPMLMRPSAYWWWFYNLADKVGITRDLEEFKAKGLGMVMLVCTANGYGADPMPHGPDFLSPGWWELYSHALKEANRLGLEMGVNVCGGWCMGGPWISKENAGRWLLQSELILTGPQNFSGKLPLPAPKDSYDSPPKGGVGAYLNLPIERVDYRDTAVVAFREREGQGSRLDVARAGQLPAKSNRLDADIFTPARTVVANPGPAWRNSPGDNPINPADVVDLTSKLGADGHLDWAVPEGRWTIVRTGHRMTGHRVNMSMPNDNSKNVADTINRMDRPIPGSSDGWEVDWFSREATDQHWNGLIKPLIDTAGPLAGKTLTFLGTDSFEDGYPNWTAKMPEMFRKYRGYDPVPYLPVFRGRIVGSAEMSDRFLHDYRKTVADCMADNNYRRLSELARPHGIDMACEAGGPSWSRTICMDALKNLGRCAMPQGEFWKAYDWLNCSKQTASAAHIYGHRLALAEAFTTCGPHWVETPAQLKPIGDRAFCDGINRFVFHTMTCTRPGDGLPGCEYGAGTHFNPNVTWWSQAAGPWLDYVSRCQALLQSGLFVADVLFYNGDGAPNLFEARDYDSLLGKGFKYDVCNSEVLLTRLSVKAGKIVLPDGMSYRALVLPEDRRMPAEVVEKLRDLVKAGAVVVGPRPESDPGLRDYPGCDGRVRAAAVELWGDCDGVQVKQRDFGEGRVYWNVPLNDVLRAEKIQPDFVHSEPGQKNVDFIHRRIGNSEIYFLANRRNAGLKRVDMTATFRVSGLQPELWEPVTGRMRVLPEFRFTEDGRTELPLSFEADGSMFIVFRSKPATPVAGLNFVGWKAVQELDCPWDVQFDKAWFYPDNGLGGRLKFEKLVDWATHSEQAVRHFSGTARYSARFDCPSANEKSLRLDLGVVHGTARVRLNGKDLGVVWCEPWQVDAGGVMREKGNELEIEVVNTWSNRLIGDAELPEKERRTRTNIPYYNKPLRDGSKHKLLTAGLLGPVLIIMEKNSADTPQ